MIKILALLLSQVIWAKTLTWQESVQLTIQNNSDLKSAEALYESTRALELGARSGYFPSVSGSLEYNDTHAEAATPENSKFYSASLNLNYKLFSGFQDLAKSRQAQANSSAALSEFQLSKADVSQKLVEAYQGLIYAQDYLKLTERIKKRRDENSRLVELRFESGRENKGSVLLSQAYSSQAEYENLQARNGLSLAQDQLKKALGLETSENFELVDGVPLFNLSQDLPSYNSLVRNHPSYEESLAQLDSSVAALDISKSAFWPTLSLTSSLGRNSPDFFPEKEKWSLGVSLNIPLFDGGRDYSQYKSSRKAVESKTEIQRATDQNLIVGLRKAFNDYIESVSKLKVDENFRKAAEVRAEIARNQYNNGLTSFVDWDNIENDLITREKTYLQSQKDRIVKASLWLQAQGKGVLP